MDLLGYILYGQIQKLYGSILEVAVVFVVGFQKVVFVDRIRTCYSDFVLITRSVLTYRTISFPLATQLVSGLQQTASVT